MTRKLSYQRYERLKMLAADFIEDYELCYPLQPLSIADLLGVRVTRHLSGLPVDFRLCSTTDGYTELIRTAHGPKFHIHLNDEMPPLRQRFTLMHEIAHVWLDHLRPGFSISEEVAEAEANFLAGYLLAPDALADAWVQVLTVENLAAEFRISEEAARLAHSRLLRARSRSAVGKAYDTRIKAMATRRVEASSVAGFERLGSA